MTVVLPSRRRASRADQELLKAILDGLPVSAIACDAELTIAYVTPHAVRELHRLRAEVRSEFGVDVDDLVGMPLHRLYRDPAGIERVLYSSGGLPHRTEFRLGAARIACTVAAACDHAGRSVGFVAVFDDVTARAATSRALVSSAAGIGEEAARLAAASDQLGAITEEVSGRAVSMSAGMDRFLELGRGVADGADMIRTSTLKVVDSAHSATVSVAELNDASGRIGDFAALITSIAEQTKLLALNATIEATRAGAAGAGFAVVAKEVKELAQRAKSATDQVAAVIESIQAKSAAVSDALHAIVSGVDTVGEQQLSVNVIVDQQVAQVSEITDMAAGLVRDMTDLTGAVDATRQVSAALDSRSAELSEATAAA